jgi:chromate reductase
MPQARILVLAGSTASASACSRLAAAFLRELAFLDAEATYVSLADYPLPLYDADSGTEPPLHARRLAGLFRANHGAFLATDEINGSLAPVLHNALDWVASVPEDRRATGTALFALAATSMTGHDGQRALSHLRDIATAAFGATIVGSLGVSGGIGAFDDAGRLAEPAAARTLQALARDMVYMARRLAAEP